MILRFKLKSRIPSHQENELLADVLETEARIALDRQELVEISGGLKNSG